MIGPIIYTLVEVGKPDGYLYLLMAIGPPNS